MHDRPDRQDDDPTVPPTAAGTPAPLHRALPLLAAANFAAATAGMVIAGLLQLIAHDLQWTASQAGRLITVYALGFALFAPLLGALLGQVCRKQVVLLGLVLVSVGSLASALSEHPGWLIASRLLVAAGGALTVPSVSAIASFLHPDQRPRALAFVLTGMTVAVILGLPLGTYVAGLWGWHVPLVGAAVGAAAAALAIKLRLPGGIVVPPVPLTAWAGLLRDGRTWPLLGVSTIVVAATFCLYAYIAPFLHEMLGIGSEGLSWLLFGYGIVSFAANLVLGRATQRIGAARLLLASLLVLTLSMALMRFTEHRLALVAALFACWAVSSAFFGTLQQARIVDAAPASASALLSLNTSASFAGQALGAALGGWLIAAVGLRALPGAAAALAALGALLYLVSRRGGDR